MNAPIWYNATHYYANSSRNSSRLKNRRCELTIRIKFKSLKLNTSQRIDSMTPDDPQKSFLCNKIVFQSIFQVHDGF